MLPARGAAALCDMPSLSSFSVDRWRLIWAIPVPLALIVLVGVGALPPSPRWLLVTAMGREQPQVAESPREVASTAATAAMRRLRGDHSTAEQEVADIVARTVGYAACFIYCATV